MPRPRSSQRPLTQQADEDYDPTQERDFDDEIDIEEAANNIVRYIICRGPDSGTFTKAELTRCLVHKPGGKFEQIITRVRNILKFVYGYNILVIDAIKGKEKHYIISNILPPLEDPVERDTEVPDDIHKALLLLILSHIFMSDNFVPDVSLYSFLKHFDIDVDLRHPYFGDVKEYINKTLIKEKYLESEFNNFSKKAFLKWGGRAEKEISKMSVLEFVCKMYKDGRKPESFTKQYETAKAQNFENYMESTNVGGSFEVE